MGFTSTNKAFGLVALAFIFWFLLFSPYTNVYIPFWPALSVFILVLNGLAYWVTRRSPQYPKILLCIEHSAFSGKNILKDVVVGAVVAVALYFVFFLGKKVLYMIWPQSPSEIASIYVVKETLSPFIIGLLLFFVVGPGEELFWRGFLQTLFEDRFGQMPAFLLTVSAYTLVHIFAFNLTIVLAALVVGVVWGLMRVYFRSIVPGMISHAVWDVMVFILFPLS